MTVAKDVVVTVHYKLSDAQNNLIEESNEERNEPMVYLHGGYGNTLAKIEEALEGKEVGFKTTIHVEPEDAFGEYDANLVKIEDMDRFPPDLQVGMQFEGQPESSEEQGEMYIYTVTDISDGKVVLDGNHPLAGMALRFALQVVEIRPATKEEIEHGHAHGAGVHDDFDDDGDGDEQYRSYPLH